MRKLVAAMNMTLVGFCDNTAMIADAELHQHYTELLRSAGAILYGRITSQLMESYWPTVAKNPTGEKAMHALSSLKTKTVKCCSSAKALPVAKQIKNPQSFVYHHGVDKEV